MSRLKELVMGHFEKKNDNIEEQERLIKLEKDYDLLERNYKSANYNGQDTKAIKKGMAEIRLEIEDIVNKK